MPLGFGGLVTRVAGALMGGDEVEMGCGAAVIKQRGARSTERWAATGM